MKFRLGQIAILLMALTAPWATYFQILGAEVPLFLSAMILMATFARSLAGDTVYFGRPMVAFLIYLVLIGLSSFWSLTAATVGLPFGLTVWTYCALAFFGVVNFLPDVRSLRRFVYASALGAVITLPQLSSYDVNDTFVQASRYAVEGHNANFTAYVLAGVFFVMALSMRYLDHSGSGKLVLLGGMGVVGVCLILLDTRGAQMSVALSGLTVFGGKLVTKSLARFASGLVILIAGAFSLGWLTPFLIWIDSLSARSTGDLSGRLLLWVDALGFILERPIFGIGPGSFAQLGTLEMGVHNIVLLVLLDTGVVGLSVFLWFLFELWRSILRLGREGQRIFFALLMYWVPIAISGHWETAPYSWGVLGFAIALTRVLERKHKQQKEAERVERPAQIPVPQSPLPPGRALPA